jgi:uracil-DNA glycosylase family protein
MPICASSCAEFRSELLSSFVHSGYRAGVARQLSIEETAAPLVPETRSLEELRAAAAGCRACDLWKTGTQTVFGEGLKKAEIVFVGEQPGDKEDLAGRPFVGPAGRVLDEALEAAGIYRSLAYVTNAVKHFKWVGRGKRRIHQKPNAAELAACRPWLDAELAVLQPQVLVVLGATAAQALLGRQFRVTKQRGVPVESDLAPHVLATVHPSSILRQETDEDRAEAMQELIADLKVVAKLLAR